MTHGRPVPIAPGAAAAPRVNYSDAPAADLLQEPGTLAAFSFGQPAAADPDPRHLHLALPPLAAPAPTEAWHVDANVAHGHDGSVQWAEGGGWLFAALQLREAEHGDDIGRTAEQAYQSLRAFLATRAPANHVQRLWNYLDRINRGEGDDERYKQFCDGRARGMRGFFADGFPAATAIGLPLRTGVLQVYCLATTAPGFRVENPRQLSAWRYPRQYGRTPPSFARAMRLPGGDALAISGTAAIIGHQSQHGDDLAAQLAEIRANLDSLLDAGGMAPGFDARAPLKVYVRHPSDAPAVAAFLDAHMPAAPRLLLQGDVCRRELLVEIDGWRYA